MKNVTRSGEENEDSRAVAEEYYAGFNGRPETEQKTNIYIIKNTRAKSRAGGVRSP